MSKKISLSEENKVVETNLQPSSLLNPNDLPTGDDAKSRTSVLQAQTNNEAETLENRQTNSTTQNTTSTVSLPQLRTSVRVQNKQKREEIKAEQKKEETNRIDQASLNNEKKTEGKFKISVTRKLN